MKLIRFPIRQNRVLTLFRDKNMGIIGIINEPWRASQGKEGFKKGEKFENQIESFFPKNTTPWWRRLIIIKPMKND